VLSGGWMSGGFDAWEGERLRWFLLDGGALLISG
jgi:hypothetical protein